MAVVSVHRAVRGLRQPEFHRAAVDDRVGDGEAAVEAPRIPDHARCLDCRGLFVVWHRTRLGAADPAMHRSDPVRIERVEADATVPLELFASLRVGPGTPLRWTPSTAGVSATGQRPAWAPARR